MNDAALRDLYERVLAERAERGASHGVSLDELTVVVERRGSEEARARILNRLLTTPEGRRELDLVRSMSQAARPIVRWTNRLPMAIAATLVIAFVGGALWRATREPDAEFRGSGASAVMLNSPGAELDDTARVVFAWKRVPVAVSYELELSDTDGVLLFQRAITDTMVVLPDDVALTGGRAYIWRVIARTETGSLASEPGRLTVRSR